jgi:hypothetical protein
MQKLCLGLLVLCLSLAGCWCSWSAPSKGGVSSQGSSSATGTFLRYTLASRAKVAAFNADVKKWFLGQGFSPVSNTTFAAIVGSDDWKKPGVLLWSRPRAGHLIYVFIPDCYHPEGNVQIIGYHLESVGTTEDVQQDRRDFEDLKSGFLRQFPAPGGGPMRNRGSTRINAGGRDGGPVHGTSAVCVHLRASALPWPAGHETGHHDRGLPPRTG